MSLPSSQFNNKAKQETSVKQVASKGTAKRFIIYFLLVLLFI
jgi:hypothetical protein